MFSCVIGGLPDHVAIMSLRIFGEKPGLPADLIAMRGKPMENGDALRDIRYVMKDGLFFKKDGVMTPEKFFHSGPTPPGAWRIH